MRTDIARAVAGAVLVVLAAGAVAAQTVKETLEVTRQVIESRRRVLVAGALPLADAEADHRAAAARPPVHRTRAAYLPQLR